MVLLLLFSLFTPSLFAEDLECPEDACYKCGCFYTCDGPCGSILTDWACDDCCNQNPRECTQSQGAPWQYCDPAKGAHYCNKQCLPPPGNLPQKPRWYDDPSKNNDEAANKGNTNDTLPIVLDWELNSWKNGGKYNNDGSLKAMAIENYGVNSFLIEIDNPDNQLFEPEKVPNSKYDTTKKVFSKCLTNDFFNSRDDGLACFFRAGKKDIKYRVKMLILSYSRICVNYFVLFVVIPFFDLQKFVKI